MNANREAVPGPEKVADQVVGLKNEIGYTSGMGADPAEPEPLQAYRPVQLCIGLDEAARVVGVSRKTMLREVRRGNLPAFRIGRNWRVRVAVLHAYIRRGEGQDVNRENASA